MIDKKLLVRFLRERIDLWEDIDDSRYKEARTILQEVESGRLNGEEMLAQLVSIEREKLKLMRLQIGGVE